METVPKLVIGIFQNPICSKIQLMSNNWIALVITFGLALGWLRLMDFFAGRGWIESKLSRKIIHIGTGPIFVLCWLLFNGSAEARWLAALVPFGITIQFALVGFGVIKDEAAVQAMSRSGSREEILRGPLFYGLVFVALTLFFWKENPVGVVALMMLCGGDGLADVVGRRFPMKPIPWNKGKSIGGALAVFLGGFVLSSLILSIFILAGVFNRPFNAYLPGLLLVAISGTLIESLPVKDIDNLTISLVSVIVGLLLF